jgi:hypothetical protein
MTTPGTASGKLKVMSDFLLEFNALRIVVNTFSLSIKPKLRNLALILQKRDEALK